MSTLNANSFKTAGLSSAALCCLAMIPSCISKPSQSKVMPNIILILTDDQGYGDLGCYGSTTLKTPNIDQMAREGMKFMDFYVHPICSPTRAALLTGCYAPRAGFPDVHVWGSPFGLNPDEVTIAEILQAEGYATACIGKWHLGEEDAFTPNQQGFDHFYGIRLVNGTQPFENFAVPFYRNDSLITIRPDHSRMTRDFTDESITFIDNNKEEPFFLYLAYTMPHIPIYPGDGFRGKSGINLYADVIEEIDWNVGRIVSKLKQEGLDDNTLIIFTSDNGPWAGHGGQSGNAGPLRGAKLSTWEGGVRVPCIMRWPGKIPPSSVNTDITGIIDIAPTLASIVGAQMLDDRIIDGLDISDLMFGNSNKELSERVYYHYAGTWLQAIRKGRWKLHFARPEKRTGIYGECAGWLTNYAGILPEDMLYDLEADIGETKNLALKYPEVVKTLKDLADIARADIGDYGVKGKNSRPIGSNYPELKHVSQYPQSSHHKESTEIMIKEMREFQKKRFDKLKKSVIPLNDQEQEELNYYQEILKW